MKNVNTHTKNDVIELVYGTLSLLLKLVCEIFQECRLHEVPINSNRINPSQNLAADRFIKIQS